MAPPFIPWPGADGLQTGSMWAWWFPNRPGPFLGPVTVVDPPGEPPVYMPPGYDLGRGDEKKCNPGEVGPNCEENLQGLSGVRPRQVPLLGRGGGGGGGRGGFRGSFGRGFEGEDEGLICGPGEFGPECAVRLEGLGGINVRQVPVLGQDFDAKPTPPPCSVGTIPVIDRGIVKCIPGSMPSGMMPMTPHQRSFPVKAYYGWKEV